MEHLQARSGLVNFEYLIGFQDGQGHDAILTPGQLWFWPRASPPPVSKPRGLRRLSFSWATSELVQDVEHVIGLSSGVNPDIGTVPNWRYIKRATPSPSSAGFFRDPRCHIRLTEFPCHRLCLVPDRQPATSPPRTRRGRLHQLSSAAHPLCGFTQS